MARRATTLSFRRVVANEVVCEDVRSEWCAWKQRTRSGAWIQTPGFERSVA